MATKPTGGTVAKSKRNSSRLRAAPEASARSSNPTIDSGSASSSARATAARTATCSGRAAAASTMMPKRARLSALSRSSSAGLNGVSRKSTVVLVSSAANTAVAYPGTDESRAMSSASTALDPNASARKT
jgi:hypothetical protein